MNFPVFLELLRSRYCRKKRYRKFYFLLLFTQILQTNGPGIRIGSVLVGKPVTTVSKTV